MKMLLFDFNYSVYSENSTYNCCERQNVHYYFIYCHPCYNILLLHCGVNFHTMYAVSE